MNRAAGQVRSDLPASGCPARCRLRASTLVTREKIRGSRRGAVVIAVLSEYHCVSASHSRAADLDKRIEHGLQVEGRAADHLEHIGGGRLLLQ